MHAPIGSLDFATGVEYHYNLNLPEAPMANGKACLPKFTATDADGIQRQAQGQWVLVKSATGYDANYWHGANSSAPDFPDLVNIGGHGNVMWFGNHVRGDDRNDPHGQSGGSLESGRREPASAGR